MKKSELLMTLKRVRESQCQTRGLWPVIQMLVHYFGDPSIPEYEFTGISHALAMHIVRAVDILRTSEDTKVLTLRHSYEWEMEGRESVPNLADVAFGGLARTGLCLTLSRDLAKFICGEEYLRLEKDLVAYFTAQDTVVMQMVDRFDFMVYQQGLCAIIDDSRDRGMAGTFGTTSLRSYRMTGRIMFTLARRIEGETIIHGDKGEKIKRLPYQELSVSFVGEDGKRADSRFGIQSMQADLPTILSMFEDVIRNWPKDQKDQMKVYEAAKGVSMM